MDKKTENALNSIFAKKAEKEREEHLQKQTATELRQQSLEAWRKAVSDVIAPVMGEFESYLETKGIRATVRRVGFDDLSSRPEGHEFSISLTIPTSERSMEPYWKLSFNPASGIIDHSESDITPRSGGSSGYKGKFGLPQMAREVLEPMIGGFVGRVIAKL